jgi:hypothetical protein
MREQKENARSSKTKAQMVESALNGEKKTMKKNNQIRKI